MVHKTESGSSIASAPTYYVQVLFRCPTVLIDWGVADGVLPWRCPPLWRSPWGLGRRLLRYVHYIQPFYIGAVSVTSWAAWPIVQDVLRS